MATFESFKRRRTQPPPPILVEMPDYMEEQDMDMSPDVRQIDRSNITVVPLDDRACVGVPEEMSLKQMGTEPCSGENDEEKQQKKRNREEIMCFYKAYRRLKACLSKNPRLGTSELAEELEDAYFGMLKLSNGCVSIRRIVAELIPRYAVFCPSALQAASRVVLQLCEWSSSIVVQGESCDEVLTQTAETCLCGLVELSVAATTIASSISSLNNTCKVVCQDVAIYLLCQLGDQELVPHNSFEEQSSDICSINKLRMLVASNLLKLFCCDPENVVGACFHLLHSDNRDQHKSGLHFINQILLHEDSSKTIPSNEGHNNAIPEPASGSKNSQEKDQLEKESSQSDEKPSQESANLITKVIHPKPALERWIVSAVHKYRRSAAHEAVAEALSTLFKLLRSLRTFVLSDLELSVEEAMEEDKPSMPTRTRHPGNLGTPERRSRVRSNITDPDVWYRDKEHWPASSQRETNMSSFGKGEGISSSRETSRRAFKTLKDSDRYFVSDNADMRVKDREGWNASFNKMEDRSWSNVWRGGKVADRNFERPVGNEGDAWSRTRDYPSNFRKESNVYVPSPQQSTTPKSRLSSPNQGPIGWYRDGDPAAMDVFAASERLWIGSLSSAVTENNLRSQFAKFGPVDGISVLSEQGFALMEYHDIRDAVKARESMQFSPIWGKPLQIKFLDASLGSRGVFGGAALGGSSHVWVGSVPSQSAKDEILKDLIATGLKGPRTVFASLSSNSILMEFDAPEEAAAVMLHIRQRRREARCAFMPRGCASGDGGGSIGGRHLWVGRVDPILQEDELLSAFSQFGELTGWKFIRQSGCCFIDFRAPESAELAKSQLNGMRFGNQCIIVEHKNNPQKNASGPILNSPPGNATFHSPSSITSGGRAAGEGSLSSALANLCSKFLITSTGNAASLCGKPRGARSGFAREGTERVPTNTLWIGLPDIVGPSFMNEGELRTLFTLAAAGIGTVTKVRSARTSRGPCRFVEFDGVETAATALHNIAGHLDPSIQIEFSNSAISLQQAEQPHIHGHVGNSHLQQFDEVPYRPWREKHRAVGRTWEWEQEPESPTPLEYSEVRGRTRHHVNPHGWNAFPEKNLAGESYYGDHRHVIYESPRDLKDEKRNDNSFKRTNDATMLSPNAGGHADSVNSTIGSPVVSQSTLIGSKHSFDAAASAPLSVRGLPHGASLAPLPVAKIQVDRVPSANSWAGPVLPPSPLDQISPSTSLHKVLMTSPMANAVYASGKLDAGTSYAPVVMPSPVTPLTDLSANIPHPVEYGMPLPPLPPASPLPPLPSETPPPPPLSPPPLPPPPSSPPPPLPSPPSQVSLTESRGKRETQNWQGPLCKSGMQYCVVVAESISTSSSQYTINMHEPVGWPEKLDVTKRADFKSVKQTFNLSSPYQREVCRLFASPSSGTANYNGFIQFIDYLKQRDRAGVVKLPSARALWSRMLYILPWSSEACELLGVGPQREDSLICLIMPFGSSASSVT